MKIGYIGLGVMGSRMALRLLDAGYTVTVYNRSPEKLQGVLEKGAKHANDLASLVKESDVVCSCLSMPSDVEQVYLGQNGLFELAEKATLFIDFTTVGRETSINLAEAAKINGHQYLDAPVSGGPEGAEQGTLTIMVGGDKGSFTKVLPVLNKLGGNVQYLGESGNGSVAKLLNQILVGVHSLAASEVMVCGASYGLNPEQLYDILKTSYGESRMLRRHMENFVLDRNFEPGGALKYLLKDIRLGNKIMQSTGLEDTLGERAEQVLQYAQEQGLGDQDMSSIIIPLERKAGTVVKREVK